MANTPADRNNAEATNKPIKGIKKVNLSELKGSLSKRGRSRFSDPFLAQAITEMFQDGEAFIWLTAVVDDRDEKTLNASKAKWRARAVSVFDSLELGNGKAISISWTDENEMVIIPKVSA